ncbi:MAG: ATP-binding protein [Bariatricus sp.]|nr:ATP-binding protein [Bariatricus sp.]
MNASGTAKEITVEAKVENLEKITSFVEEALEEIGCPMKVQIQMNVAIDEIFSNICYYAYQPGTGDATILLDISENPTQVTVTFIDQGIPYDPLKQEEPDTTLSADERTIGGLGIFMVKKSMDELSYEYKDGKNILNMKKNL